MATGYGHPEYAASLGEFGTPRALPRCDGWLLDRSVAGTAWIDSSGCYPIFACGDWSALGADLHHLGSDVISVVLVADPLGGHDPELLSKTFNAGAIPFKLHQVIEFGEPLDRIVASHHQRNVRKALRVVHVERVSDPLRALNDWARLYDNLIRRHSITGIRAFSRRSFEVQLATPGMIAFRAVNGGETIGMLLFYLQGEAAYYHLGAYSERGYELGAAFALFWTALEYLREMARFVSLGGDAGTADTEGGLARFKRGWANTTRQAFLCRHVGDAARYNQLASRYPPTSFFPAYRRGEFSDPAPVPETSDD